MSNSRTLKFAGHDLGIDVTLMLTFTAPNVGRLYVDEFPLCWKIIKLGKSGHVSAEVTYTPNTAFLAPQIVSGNVVVAGNWQECAIGDRCDLLSDGSFSKPLPGVTNFLECTNKTTTPASIGVGFYDKDNIAPSVIWNNIAVSNTLKAQVTARLQIYSTSDFQQSEMITGDIESPILWDRQIMPLATVTNLTVSVDPNTLEVSIA